MLTSQARNRITLCWRFLCLIYTTFVLIVRLRLDTIELFREEPFIPAIWYFTFQTLVETVLHFLWNIGSTISSLVTSHPKLFGPRSFVSRFIFEQTLVDLTITVVLYWTMLYEEKERTTLLDYIVFFENISYHGLNLILLWIDMIIDANLPRKFRITDALIVPIRIIVFVFFMDNRWEVTGKWIYPALAGAARPYLLVALPATSSILALLYRLIVTILSTLPYYRRTIGFREKKEIQEHDLDEQSEINLRALFSAVNMDISEVDEAERLRAVPPGRVVVAESMFHALVNKIKKLF